MNILVVQNSNALMYMQWHGLGHGLSVWGYHHNLCQMHQFQQIWMPAELGDTDILWIGLWVWCLWQLEYGCQTKEVDFSSTYHAIVWQYCLSMVQILSHNSDNQEIFVIGFCLKFGWGICSQILLIYLLVWLYPGVCCDKGIEFSFEIDWFLIWRLQGRFAWWYG